MQGLRATLPAQGKMNFVGRSKRGVNRNSRSPYALASVPPTELPELISALESHFEKVKAHAAFLDLKKSELHPDDYMSLTGMMDAREQLRIEQSLLSGHAFMIQEMVNRKNLKLDKRSDQILRRVLSYTSAMTNQP